VLLQETNLSSSPGRGMPWEINEQEPISKIYWSRFVLTVNTRLG